MAENASSGAVAASEVDFEEIWAAQQSNHQVRLTRETAHECWVGRKEKLLRIEQYLVESLKAVFVEQMAEAADDLPPQAVELMARRLQLKVVVTSGNGKIRRSGELATVLGEMDLSEVERIEMRNRTSVLGLGRGAGPEVRLSLGTDSDEFMPRILRGPKGVRWEVSGDDRQWVGGTFDWVASEIAKDVPWWWFIRTRASAIVMSLLISVGIAGILFATVDAARDGGEGTAEIVAGGGLVLLYGLVVGTLILRPILASLFPSVELIEPGSSPKGRQVLAVAVGVVSLGLSVAGVVLGALAL
ncbi:hypothetical protein [Nocardioides pantholopis]|uniref:hypothetical protein n=1 Tax=Nocardioides pantholopis TaxID=2483798 RepID=UPI000FDA929F|nr:hypothetical protein [Nocardioides pantholopis]